MNIYAKLQAARVKFHSTKLEKSGHNKFAGYKYFELGDFLPIVQTIFNDIGLTGIVRYYSMEATLTIYEHDGNGTIVFSSPRAEVALKGCHPIQNEGAIQTYQRRYLWTSCLELVEHDVIDIIDASQPEQKKSNKPDLTPKMEQIVNYCKELLDANDPAFAAEWADMTPLQKEAVWPYLNSKQKQASKTIIYNANKGDSNE